MKIGGYWGLEWWRRWKRVDFRSL